MNLFCSPWQIMDRIEVADQQKEVDYRQLFGVPDHDDASTAFTKAKTEKKRWKLAGLHPDQRPDVGEDVEARLKDCNEKLEGLWEKCSESTFVRLTELKRKMRIEQWREAQKKEAQKKEAQKKSGETPLPAPALPAPVRRLPKRSSPPPLDASQRLSSAHLKSHTRCSPLIGANRSGVRGGRALAALVQVQRL